MSPTIKGPVHQGIAGLKPYQPGKPIDELTRELGISRMTVHRALRA